MHRGGAALLANQAYFWTYREQGMDVRTAFPGNVLMRPFGIAVVDEQQKDASLQSQQPSLLWNFDYGADVSPC